MCRVLVMAAPLSEVWIAVAHNDAPMFIAAISPSAFW
jgi:hypothetical protein